MANSKDDNGRYKNNGAKSAKKLAVKRKARYAKQKKVVKPGKEALLMNGGEPTPTKGKRYA